MRQTILKAAIVCSPYRFQHVVAKELTRRGQRCSASYIAKIIAGDRYPPEKMRKMLSEMLGLSEEKLFSK